MQFDALLFDLDGTLVDSTEAVMFAWTEWANRHQLAVSRVLAYIHGRPAAESIAHFLPEADAARLKQERDWLEALESTDLRGTVALPGAVELIAAIQERKLPWAVVTSGTSRVAEARLKAAALPVPEVFVTADHVKQGKPHPQPYLLAAKQLCVEPEACIVFEDAPAGIASAKAAGCSVVGLAAEGQVEHQPEPDICLSGLQEVQIGMLDNKAKLVFASLI